MNRLDRSTEAVHYLDNAASAPVRREAIDALVSVLEECYANPSGAHALARAARRRIDDARDVMAQALGCLPGEIVFTGGGTEADNLAVFGVHTARGGTVVCTAVEHHAVLHPVEHLRGRIVEVDRLGRVDLDHLAASLDPSVTLVSVGLVNGETGVIADLDTIADVVQAHAPDALIHTDAVQAMAWLDVAAAAARADLISIAGHKFGAPKGIGALVVRSGVPIEPVILGGGQERGLRSGTQNAPGIVAMAAATVATLAGRAVDVARVGALRDRLADGIRSAVAGTHETGVVEDPAGVDRSGKVAGSCHLCFDEIESEAMLVLLERAGVFASAASSCSSGAQEPSHVLAAMGFPRELAGGSLRLSLGYTTVPADVDAALEAVPAAVERLRRTGS